VHGFPDGDILASDVMTDVHAHSPSVSVPHQPEGRG
jgi:hypothetical protein